MAADENVDEQNAGAGDPANNDPDCLSEDDAIAAVLKCLGEILGRDASDVDVSTPIGDLLPDTGGQPGLRRLLACLRTDTGFNLDAGDFAGKTFQDIVDKLTC